MTVTYIAADWDHDKNAVDILYDWKDSYLLDFSFEDVHEWTQSRDDSLSCSIKASLLKRIKVSDVFVLVVGLHTNTITKGGCQFCRSYNSWGQFCVKGYSADYKSFVKYECDKAIENGLKVVVLYNDVHIDKSLCPEILRNRGTHAPMVCERGERYYWDFEGIKKAIGA